MKRMRFLSELENLTAESLNIIFKGLRLIFSLESRGPDRLFVLADVIEVADHHFFPGLVAPAYGAIGVRIGLISG